MTSPEQKKMRLDTASTSKTEPAFTLRIIRPENRHEGRILELDTEGYDREPTANVELDELVDQIFFQDNTMAFRILLAMKKLGVVIYPPGSGKTTMALLFASFLSSSIAWSKKLSTFFENCEYAKTCRDEYDKLKKSSNVAYISFEEIRGSTRAAFEKSLIQIMLACFKEHFSESVYLKVQAMLEESSENVYISLGRFALELRDKTKTTYLLLDSCDTVYNTIVQLGNEAIAVCKEFTKFIKGAVPTGSSGIVVICFGVSPYFAHEFSTKAHIHDIGRSKNELGKYFSYSTETIEKVIEEWKLNTRTSLNECMKVAQFQFNKCTLINPGICVSFLKSLHLEEECFHVSIIPRSLRLSSIFTLEDRELLLNVLSSSCEQKFEIGVSIMTIISNFQKPSRKLFYPLFIFGGFISCKPGGSRNKYILEIANETSKCLLEKSLNDMYITEYECGLTECSEMYKMIFASEWQKFCDSISRMLSSRSTRTMSNERDYNNWLEGLLNVAKLQGYSVTVKNNVALAGLFPDITSSGVEKIAAVWELKFINAVILRKKIRNCSTLGGCYSKIIIDEAHKSALLAEIKTEFKEAEPQISQYATSFLTAKKYKSVKCFIAIFYLNHVMLFVKDYYFQSRSADDVPSSTWTLHCSDGFFSQTDLSNLMELCDLII